MPRLKYVVECPYTPTFRSAKVAGMFDVPVADKLTKAWDITIPIEDKPWQIGLIVGASGSGKTTLAKQLFKDKLHQGYTWNANCLLDDFPAGVTVEVITETLSKVGFSSPPSWLLPYSVLSNGQKFRVELARGLIESPDLFVFDEFTSVVDRQVACVGTHAFQKAIRKTHKQFVAVTCHYDVEPWLQPDWVYDLTDGSFKWGSLPRPQLNLEIRRVHHTAWNLFKEHHYLSAKLNKAAVCYVGFLDGRPVVFDSWLCFFGRLTHGKAMRGHRTVCLPDFQGLGLGYRLFTELTHMWAGLGYRVFSRTAHPAEIKKRLNTGEWKLTNQGRTARDGGGTARAKRADERLTVGFEFTGAPMPVAEARSLYGN